MAADGGAVDVHVRAVAEEEIETFAQNGWVLLPELFDPAVAASVRERAEALLKGERRGIRQSDTEVASGRAGGASWFDDSREPSRTDPFLASLVNHRQMGRNAALLLGRDTAMRRLTDFVAVKMPVSTGSGDATLYHQDHNVLPFDRTAVTLWMAIDEITPEQGSLRFYNGSHGLGLLGNAAALDGYPRLKRCPISPAHHMRPGDVTAHGSMTIHGAGANVSERPRWTYIASYFPADTRYTGQPFEATDGLRLKPFAPAADDTFPLVYEPTA